MDKYEKPCLLSQTQINGIIPLAAVGAAVAGLSAAELAGIASVAGLALGMASSNSRGSSRIVMYKSDSVLQELV